MTLDPAVLRERLNYDPDTGAFTWKTRVGQRGLIGGVGGTVTKAGYIRIAIKRRAFMAHRLAWLAMTGRWPVEIDHINQIKTDNRWSNLREVTRLENIMNTGLARNNSSGVKNVRFRSGRWEVRFQRSGRDVVRKRFKNFNDAAVFAETLLNRQWMPV